MEGAGAHFHIEWLQHDAALFRPELLQCQDEPLESLEIGGSAHVKAGKLQERPRLS